MLNFEYGCITLISSALLVCIGINAYVLQLFCSCFTDCILLSCRPVMLE